MHILFVVNRTFNETPTERLQQHPLLFTMNHTNHTFFLWRLHLARPSHPGQSTILLRSKARVESVQSFTLWQQATIEITCHVTLLLLVRATYIYIGAILHAHPVHGESHIQRNTNWEVATVGLVRPFWLRLPVPGCQNNNKKLIINSSINSEISQLFCCF